MSSGSSLEFPKLISILEENDSISLLKHFLQPIDTGNFLRRTTLSTTLAAAENTRRKEQTFEEMVPSVYHEYRTVFEEEASQALPPRCQWDHAIDLKSDACPSNNCKIYLLNLEEQGALDVFLEDMTKHGYIRPSQSPFASPFFFVKKKDGKLRLVQDYCQLNAMTIKNQYPLPLISDTIDKLKNACIFSKFDVRWGYNNVRIKEGDEWKAAFKTNCGMFEPLVMFFGLMNSPATFQSMMNRVRHGYGWTHGFCRAGPMGTGTVSVSQTRSHTATRDVVLRCAAGL
jgi:Reverse transcriptase (RNA-dependent DNA polymerase)